jgi:hypothetical protein
VHGNNANSVKQSSLSTDLQAQVLPALQHPHMDLEGGTTALLAGRCTAGAGYVRAHLLTAASTEAALLLVSLSKSMAAALLVDSCCRNCCAPALGLLLLLLAAAPALAALRGEFDSHATACCAVLKLGPFLGWFKALRGSKSNAKTRVFTVSAAEACVAWLDASMVTGCANTMSCSYILDLTTTADACSVATQAHQQVDSLPLTAQARCTFRENL